LFNAKLTHFQLYRGDIKLHLDGLMMLSVMHWTNLLSWNFKVFADCNNRPCVDMSFHSDRLSWFRDNQSMILHNNLDLLAAKQWIQI